MKPNVGGNGKINNPVNQPKISNPVHGGGNSSTNRKVLNHGNKPYLQYRNRLRYDMFRRS